MAYKCDLEKNWWAIFKVEVTHKKMRVAISFSSTATITMV